MKFSYPHLNRGGRSVNRVDFYSFELLKLVELQDAAICLFGRINFVEALSYYSMPMRHNFVALTVNTI